MQGTGLHGKEEENFVERANLVVPPAADPHGGWCGGWELKIPGYPIRPMPALNIAIPYADRPSKRLARWKPQWPCRAVTAVQANHRRKN